MSQAWEPGRGWCACTFMTQNVSTQCGLSNGSTGKVMDIVYHGDGEFDKPPYLPKYIWVDFGDTYSGPTFFPNNPDRKGWVPVFPVEFEEYSINIKKSKEKGSADYDTHSRKMFPIKLAWAWTHWKSQGQTIRIKCVLHLGKSEKTTGTSYVDFSRCSSLGQYGIAGGCTVERLTTAISKHPQLKLRLQAEKKLRDKAALTVARVTKNRELEQYRDGE